MAGSSPAMTVVLCEELRYFYTPSYACLIVIGFALNPCNNSARSGFDLPDMSSNAFFSDLLASISERGRTLLRRVGSSDAKQDASDLIELCEALLSGRGEASGTAMAREVLDRYHDLDDAGRLAFFESLTRDFGPDRERLAQAIESWRDAAERRRRQRPAFCLRAAAAGTDPPAQPRARRHQRAGGDARRSARRHERRQGSCRARPRRRASAVFMVQQGISRAAQDRLVDAGEHSGKDHSLRGGARNPRLGRSAPPHRPRRPALLRLLPSRAGRRAPDLRRGGADGSRFPARSRRCSPKTASWCRSSAPAPRCSIRSPTPSAASAGFPSATS